MRYKLSKNEIIILYGKFFINKIETLFWSLLISFLSIGLIRYFFSFGQVTSELQITYIILYLEITLFIYLVIKHNVFRQEIVFTNKKIFIKKKRRYIVLYPKITELVISDSKRSNHLTIKVMKQEVKLYNISNIIEIKKLIKKSL